MHRSQIVVTALVASLSSAADAGSTRTAGINLNRVTDYISEAPFIDVVRRSRSWIQNFDGKPWGEGEEVAVDDHGWPVKLLKGQRATTLMTPSGGVYPGGKYTCSWTGRGRISVSGGARGTMRANKATVQLSNKSAWLLSITETDPDDPLKDLSCVESGLADRRDEIFRPQFLERWAPFGTLRFMDWLETNDSTLKSWDGRPLPTDRSWGIDGVPVEIVAQLANRQQADAWINIPHLADDNFVYEFAKTLKQELDPKLRIYVEYSNEVWNYRFKQSTWAFEQGKKTVGEKDGFATRAHYYGVRSAEIFDIFADVFQDDAKRLVNVIAGQAVNPTFIRRAIKNSSAARRTHAIAIAPYVSLNVQPESKPSHAEVRDWSVDDVFAHIEKTALPGAIKAMRESKKLATALNVRLIAYEGGQHLVGVGEPVNDEQLTELLTAANRDPRMGDVYRRYLEAWDSISGDLMVLFSSMQAPSKWGNWGLLESEIQTEASAHKLNATLDWIKKGQP